MESSLLRAVIADRGEAFENASNDLRFAAAVAEYGMTLRNSQHKGRASLADVLSVARASRGDDLEGYRGEFIQMVEATEELMRATALVSQSE